MLFTEKQLRNFWNKVNKTDTCWLWVGCKNSNGYGSFGIHRKPTQAHVVSYKLHNDDYDPTKDVCHRCDIALCVNPNHLFLGTRSENMKDCVSKGRFRKKETFLKGEKASHSKLTEKNAIDIKTRLATGERICDINRVYNTISRGAIQGIKDGKNWKEIII